MLFNNGSPRKAKKLQEILETYSAATGMEVNIQKSAISFNGLEPKMENQLIQVFPFRQFSFQEMLKNLGFFKCQMDMGRKIGLGFWKK